MGKISLMDCTLRDGGYINDWHFGEKAIKDITAKMVRTGIEYVEIGFIKDKPYDKDKSIYNHNVQMAAIIAPKNKERKYVGMVDMGEPMPLEKLGPRVENSIDILRVIFKKDRIDEGYEYCRQAKELGYEIFVQIVATNAYSDKELVDIVEKFNPVYPQALYIVDTLGVIKRKDFLRMVQIMDHNLYSQIALGYHAHNNLQQASGNAEALAEMNLQRDIILDACVFGMGRGAGNMNMELFAEYLNENYGKTYRLEPMLEVIDEYLNDIYSKEFWGYSLPFYLSASNLCHPNYAKFFAKKGTLTVKAFNEILGSIPDKYKEVYMPELAEKVYQEYQENYVDDKATVSELRGLFSNREILLLGPGKSIEAHRSEIIQYINDVHPIVVALNFIPDDINVDYIFSNHIRRYSRIQGQTDKKTIITSNIRDAKKYDYIINFASYASKRTEIMDNSGIMFMNLLLAMGNQTIILAGLDGYEKSRDRNYVNSGLEYHFGDDEAIDKRNNLLKQEFDEFRKRMHLEFLTESKYNDKNCLSLVSISHERLMYG